MRSPRPVSRRLLSARLLSSAACLLALVLPLGTFAQPIDVGAVPVELRPWIPWVLHGQETQLCPRAEGRIACLWPGRLELTLGDDGGQFTLQVTLDASATVPLPGGDAQWPRDLTVDGGATVLVPSQGAAPQIRVDAGSHVIRGRFEWLRLPESLPVPQEIALVDLDVRGERRTHVRREPNGDVWLQEGRVEATTEEEQRVTLDVQRLIRDGVPVTLTTRLRFRVSGDPREIDLGNPLPPGFVPTEITSGLPARIDSTGSLRVQLRAGDWDLRVEARSETQIATLSMQTRAEPWPPDEVWAFSSDAHVRTVELGGAPGIDPERTTLPDEWRRYPAFHLGPGGDLTFTEMWRGEAQPPPDEISVSRDIWLAQSGDILNVRDVITGQLHTGGRIEVADPGQLGRVTERATGRVITQMSPSSPAGVELRSGSIDLSADMVYPSASTLPAIGWSRDVQSLSASVRIPPGWTVLAASGADSAPGTWVDRWELLDLFVLLLIVIAVRKLADLRWAILTFFVLGLSWYEPNAIRFAWIWLAILSALVMLFAGKRFVAPLQWARWAVVLYIAVAALVFVWDQTRTAFFPHLAGGAPAPYAGRSYDADDGVSFDLPTMGGASAPMAPPAEHEAREEAHQEGLNAPGGVYDAVQVYRRADSDGGGRDSRVRERRADGEIMDRLQTVVTGDSSLGFASRTPDSTGEGYWSSTRSAQVDPAAVVQTGPGIPRWEWTTLYLSWNGPVSAEQSVRLYLISPFWNGLLSLLRALGLVFIVLRLSDPRRITGMPPVSSGPGSSPAAGTAAGSGAASSSGPASTVASSVSALALVSLAGVAWLAPCPAEAQEKGFPSDALLNELRERLMPEFPDDPARSSTAQLSIHADAAGIRIEAEVHVQAPTGWPLPGPDSEWSPSVITVDGADSVSLRRRADRYVEVRLPAGVHHIVAFGAARDEVALQFAQVPHVLLWSGTEWTIEGYRADAPPPNSVQISRIRELRPPPGGSGDGSEEFAPSELPAWLQVVRVLDIGVPWLVHNELRRRGPAGAAVVARVPLLPGESITSAGVTMEGREAIVSVQRAETVVRWDSTLAEVDHLTLTAPADRPWTEQWELACSPVWNCVASGVAPSRHMSSGSWNPSWLPWPGESLELTFVRPAGIDGETTTIDEATLSITSGRRIRESALVLSMRSSRGGQQRIGVPANAEIQAFTLDGLSMPQQVENGAITFNLEPGTHVVEVRWREEASSGVIDRAPAVTVGGSAVNVTVSWDVADNRWVLLTGGPSWGPVVTIWQFVLVLAIAAFLLARLAPTPLRFVDWFLLGLGMTQTEVGAPVIVVMWLVALGLRGRWKLDAWWRRDIAQLTLVGLTIFAMAMLIWAVGEGLALRPPNMWVEGAGSWSGHLQWYADRIDGSLPQPVVVSVHVWAWHIAMLLWALWMAFHLLKWLKWGWGHFTSGGAWAWPPRPAPMAYGQAYLVPMSPPAGATGSVVPAPAPQASSGRATSSEPETVPPAGADPDAGRAPDTAPGASGSNQTP